MDLNILAILLASVLQFVFSAIWYTPIFGKIWGQIHGFDKVSKAEQAKMQKSMAPLMIAQFLLTILTTTVFALMMNGLPMEWNVYGIAGFYWIGFIVPTQASAVIFGGTEPKWIAKKIAIMAGASFFNLMIAAAVISKM